jgi:hypothetical protein
MRSASSRRNLGLDKLDDRCSACHSLDYVLISP